jgi:hypothetical protein
MKKNSEAIVEKGAISKLRKALSACIGHFGSAEATFKVLRLKWDYPDPSCLNAAEVNRLAFPLGRGDVFEIAKAEGDVTVDELTVRHPTEECPAFFAAGQPGAIPREMSEYDRQSAEANLAAWLDLTGAEPHDGAGHSVLGSKPRAKKATVNARMIDALQSHPEAIGWTAKKWSQHLRCSPAAIVATNAWKSMKLDREKGRAERAKDRRRRKRHFGNSN